MGHTDPISGSTSSPFRPRILSTAELDEGSLAELRGFAEVEDANYRKAMRMLKEERLVELLADFDVFITEIDLVDARSIQALPRLRVVATCRGDAVNVDVDACTAFGIPVVHAPGRNADAVADLALSFFLMCARKLPAATRFLREPGIRPGDLRKMGEAHSTLRGNELWRKKVGLIGFGAVGRAVARRLQGFGTHVVTADPFVDADSAALDGAQLVTLEELLESSDFVSLHASVTDETEGLLDAAALRRMKESAFLINTARAALLDEIALAKAIESGEIAGAALDTFSVEPPGSDHPLLSLPGVIATPHIGGNSEEIAVHQGIIVTNALKKLLHGETPDFAVLNPDVAGDLDWDTPRRAPTPETFEALLAKSAPAFSDLAKKSQK